MTNFRPSQRRPSGGCVRTADSADFGRSPPDPVFWEPSTPNTDALSRTHKSFWFEIILDCVSGRLRFESGATALDKMPRLPSHPPQAHIYPGRHDWHYFAEHLPIAGNFLFCFPLAPFFIADLPALNLIYCAVCCCWFVVPPRLRSSSGRVPANHGGAILSGCVASRRNRSRTLISLPVHLCIPHVSAERQRNRVPTAT